MPHLVGKTRILHALMARGYSHREASIIYAALDQVFRQAKEEGANIRVFSLGILKWRPYASRKVRNPRTGEIILLPERKRLRFYEARDEKKIDKEPQKKGRI